MEVSVVSIINQIRQNITDRYKSGFPIIKELVQNADDAYAERIDLVFTQGIASASHPLLQGPALLVINDGSFDERNAKAINSIGLSSKAGNQNAVGRYGLGLKSVFHLCEAFFFLSTLDEALHIVNPWAGTTGPGIEEDKVHPEWNTLSSADYLAVTQLLQPILKPYKRFFCLWLPLRRESHFDNHRHPIVHEIPGRDWAEIIQIISPVEPEALSLENEIGRLFPQLRALKTFRVLRLQDDKKAEVMVDINIADEATRLAFPTKSITPNHFQQFGGHLSVKGIDGKNSAIDYAGIEEYMDEPTFTGLQNSNYWPRHSNQALDSFELIEQRDNTQPHTAAVFLRFPNSSKGGQLGISRAVYLPLGKQSERVANDSNRSFGLTLHGWFFVDAGRTELSGWEHDYTKSIASGEELRLSWNGALAQKGTLQSVIPALDIFASSLNLPAQEIFALTAALQKSQLFQVYKKFISSKDVWYFEYHGKASKWVRNPAWKQILEIPELPKTDPERPTKIFPRFLEQRLITLEGFPRLLLDGQISAWQPRDLVDLLAAVPVEEVFTNQGLLDYLVKVFEKALGEAELKPVSDEQLIKSLLKVTRDAFAKIELKKLYENQGLIRKLCGLIPSEFKFSLSGDDSAFKSTANTVLLQRLFQEPLDILLTPNNFDNSPAGSSQKLGYDNAQKILNALSETENGTQQVLDDDLRSRIALQIFKSVPEIFILKNRCGALKLFSGTRFENGKPQEIPLSITDLIRLNQENVLFCYTPDGARSTRILRELCNSIKGIQPVIIKNEVNDGLKLSAPDSNPLGCLYLLESKPILTAPSERRELASLLLRELDTDMDNAKKTRIIQAVRYLFHGDPYHYGGQEYLYFRGKEIQASQIFTQIALKSSHQEWRILDPELTGILTADARQKLNITELGDSSAIHLLNSITPQECQDLDFREISETERNNIIIFLYRNGKKEILKNLAIHETPNGTLVSITPQTFMESTFILPDEVAADAILIQKPRESLLGPIYENLDVHILGASSAIALALHKKEPQKYWLTIMNALGVLDVNTDTSTVQALQEGFWLPSRSDGGISPQQVLQIPGMESEISSILKEFRSEYASYADLQNHLTHHASWEKLQSHILPEPSTVIRRLGALLSQSGKYGIGAFEPNEINESLIDTMLFVFEQSPGMHILPAAAIIQKIRSLLGTSVTINLSIALARPLSSSQLVEIFTHLVMVHDKIARDQQDAVLNLFERYLKQIAGEIELKQLILPKIKLLNQNHLWKLTSELVYKAKGIDPEHLLDLRQGNILKLSDTRNVEEKIISAYDASSYETDFKAGAEKLVNYFQAWEPFIQNKEVLGGFLCLLGNQPELHNTAKRYLGIRDVDATRGILAWEETATFHSGESGPERIKRQKFFIRIVEPQAKKTTIKSIAGTEFEALLLRVASLEHLIFDSSADRPVPPHINKDGMVYSYLCLRKIDPAKVDPGRLINLLKATAKIVLFEAYYQDIRNFDTYWQELEQTDQLDIEIAQENIIENIFGYIPTLGLATHEAFNSKIRAWDDIRSREIQSRQNARRNGSKVENFEKDREFLRTEFKNLFENEDIGSQSKRELLLGAVRYKIGQEFQYKPSSILFELFQNADDAVAELGMLLEIHESRRKQVSTLNIAASSGGSLNSNNRRVVVDFGKNYIRLAHWGRTINQIQPGDGIRYGYGEDLVKMLMMQRSDKLISSQLGIKPLTGKFGLGFKSVFLISDKPSILSGRIKFDIVGGLYPLRMKTETLGTLANILDNLCNGKNQDGTLIELPADARRLPEISTDNVVDDFYQWADFLVVFSHELNRVELRQEGRILRTIEWIGEGINENSEWQVGKLQHSGSIQKTSLTNILVWKPSRKQAPDDSTEENKTKDFQGSILFALNPSGFTQLEPRVPRIWVTAPTEEVYPVGFILNSNFALDVGRAQLARSSEDNLQLASDLGNKFGKALINLYEISHTHWADFCSRTGLREYLTEQDFWETAWQVSCEPMQRDDSRDGYKLLKICLDLGFGSLYKEYATLPTGLYDSYRSLTKLQDLRFYISGSLEKSEVFAKISAWPEFQEKFPPGSVISKSMRDVLNKLFSDLPELIELSLWKIVDWIIGPTGKVSAEQADLLGSIITPDFFGTLDRSEEEQLHKFLKGYKFKTVRGTFVNVSDMLAQNVENVSDFQDEDLRSEFAPPEFVLSKEYNKPGTLFFRASREKLSAPVEKMAEWVFDVKNLDRKRAVVIYLVKGQLSEPLSKALLHPAKTREFELSWLMNVVNDPNVWNFLSEHDQRIFFGRLHIEPEMDPNPPSAPLPPVGEILERIYIWWEKNQVELIEDYEQSVYPYGQPLTVSAIQGDPDDADTRREWMILFLLGSFHTIGRLNHQAYRNFIEDCDAKGWLNIFIDSASNANDWIDVLDSYVEKIRENEDEKYQYLFMRQFVNIYKLSSGLKEYAELFLGADRFTQKFSLDHLNHPNKSEILSGSGFPMLPNLSKTLGNGTGMILRELVRKDVLKSQYVFEHCYSPVPRLRTLIVEMEPGFGDGTKISESKQIYGFLVNHLGPGKATFNKAFDIPFLMLKEKYNDLHSFLDAN